jgi:microcystin-dependent protein
MRLKMNPRRWPSFCNQNFATTDVLARDSTKEFKFEMPSSNGVYSLPVGYLAVTGSTIQASQHNPPLEDIAAALTGRLSRDGTAPMTGALALAAGAVGAPGLAFASDPTTGLYKTAAGFGVAVGGAKVAEFLAGGIIGSRVVGELVHYVGSTVPSSLWVFPVGQTLSRTTYATLWAFAQVEIAAGNLFFNNGNGSTTFGIGDLRGRVIAAPDSSTAILTITSPDGKTLGAIGGTQATALALANLPTGITSANASQAITVSLPGAGKLGYGAIGDLTLFSASATGAFVSVYSPANQWAFTSSISGNNAIAVTSNNTSGSAHLNVQPTMIANCILFVGN